MAILRQEVEVYIVSRYGTSSTNNVEVAAKGDNGVRVGWESDPTNAPRIGDKFNITVTKAQQGGGDE